MEQIIGLENYKQGNGCPSWRSWDIFKGLEDLWWFYADDHAREGVLLRIESDGKRPNDKDKFK